jgi:mono/diheme cytochrome c family protein
MLDTPERSGTRHAPRATRHAFLFVACALALTGCRQQMASQPSYRPLRPSSFFADGRSARPLVEGTVSRGELRADRAYYTGRTRARPGSAEAAAGLVGAPGLPAAGALVLSQERANYVDVLPFPQKDMGKMLRRGQDRFDIYCAVCHGRDGDGKGMIPQRGFTDPPNFHTDLSRGFRLKGFDVSLREVPVGYFFEVITEGFGAMPDYREQVPVEDRWAVIAYVRALQFSRHVRLAELGPVERQRLLAAGGQK